MVREDDLRATFHALHAQGTPARPFAAADIIREGAKRRRAHRVWAVAGTGLATAAAVVAALLVLPAKEPAPQQIQPADRPTVGTTTGPPSSSWNPSTSPPLPPQTSAPSSSVPPMSNPIPTAPSTTSSS
ncbi:hypothetical protein Lesp02_48860 [Lentzea sp. NBRC 105346]|uniref:hypothetical protein n=1 Tax=Lentzea sp. NBRC 105346 TaxID=3032205 RepID=UPI0024A5F586|nr:hypothetical protein [Lentzea sp. NBRC 105346]GLZ32698.1 hypothetical protein Lesp02_48860 [Lentzea sp. NBRC 105346]